MLGAKERSCRYTQDDKMWLRKDNKSLSSSPSFSGRSIPLSVRIITGRHAHSRNTDPCTRSALDCIINFLKMLAQLGERYKNQTAWACLTIIGDLSRTDIIRLKTVEILAKLGEAYKYQAEQAYSFIHQNKRIVNLISGHMIL